jgi:hypothetical protein
MATKAGNEDTGKAAALQPVTEYETRYGELKQ